MKKLFHPLFVLLLLLGNFNALNLFASNSLNNSTIGILSKSNFSTENQSFVTQKLYYIDPVNGNNSNRGDLPQNPLKDLTNIQISTLIPGTKILFKAGTTFNGTVILSDFNGTKAEPVTVSSYWDGVPSTTAAAAAINGASYLSALELNDCSFIEVNNLILTANGGGFVNNSLASQQIRCGVLFRTTKAGVNSDVHLTNLTIHDVYFNDPGFNGAGVAESSPFGYGIRFYNQNSQATLKNITVSNCIISNLEQTGIKFTGSATSKIDSVSLTNNTVTNVGGPGMQASNIRYSNFAYNTIDHSGAGIDSRMWQRGSGFWIWQSLGVLIEHNSFTNANGPADSAGAHIDFNNTDVVMQYNFSANNAGGFVEILGNNRNCAYRYNVSVNDGWRTKGVDGATQDGKILWVSGYVGVGKTAKGPYYSYIYNNTIYVQNANTAKFCFESSANGILIVNNIFNIIGTSKSVFGANDSTIKTDSIDVFFKNNLFLNRTIWSSTNEKIIDSAPLYGSANFLNAGGMTIQDYNPNNLNLIKGKGITIPILPGDSIGLKIGLKVTKDILGNSIGNVLDMGAIAISPFTDVKESIQNKSHIIVLSDGLKITNDGEALFTLFSINGEVLQMIHFTDSTTIACSKGVYVGVLNGEVHKIIVG